MKIKYMPLTIIRLPNSREKEFRSTRNRHIHTFLWELKRPALFAGLVINIDYSTRFKPPCERPLVLFHEALSTPSGLTTKETI